MDNPDLFPRNPDPNLFENTLENIAKESPKGCSIIVETLRKSDFVSFNIAVTLHCLEDLYWDSLNELQNLQIVLAALALETGGLVTLPGDTEITTNINSTSAEVLLGSKIRTLRLVFSCSFLID